MKREGRNLADIDDEARHEARKSAKKLRYAAEFLQGLFERKNEKRRHKRFVKALEALQDQLGALNDLAAAPDVLKKLGVADDAGAADLLAHGKKGNCSTPRSMRMRISSTPSASGSCERRDHSGSGNGGAGGIRTHDTLLTYTHFPGERLRPLGHRSACTGTGALIAWRGFRKPIGHGRQAA